jgi:hypothetical protein
MYVSSRMFNRTRAIALVGGRMSEEREILIGRTFVFSVGMALLLLSVYGVILYAAFLISHPLMTYDIISPALFAAFIAWIGSLLAFLGWHSKQNPLSSS